VTVELAGKKVLVVGLARTGVAAALFCHRRGAQVTVSDRQPASALGESLAALGDAPIVCELGGHREETFRDQDLIVLSPGVPLFLPALRAAHATGIPIWAEIELAARFLTAPIVAVTGTNGKTTTVSLLGDVFLRARKSVFVGGNIGTPLLEAVGRSFDVLVVEVSSYQLEAVQTFAPRVAVHLNLSPDHLERHGSLEAYALLKERLFAFQRPEHEAVLNADCPFAARVARRTRAQSWLFSGQRELPEGAFLDGETLVLRLRAAEERYDARSRRLLGQHNLENLLVMATCARLLGVPRAAIEETISRFAGLPHRLELVRTRRGVRFFNDSKATNVESAMRSLQSVPGPIRLIAGGRHKGASYAPLRPFVQKSVRALYLIGEAAPLLAADLGDLVPVRDCADLETAVHRAAAEATDGEAVLLAPACASFDQFQDYEKRGDRFRALVEALP
jgi:UDP-N-acetylmuramoylalanine--D-glutamate ligase